MTLPIQDAGLQKLIFQPKDYFNDIFDLILHTPI